MKVEASLILAGALFQSLAASIVKLLAAFFVLQSSFQILVVRILTTLSCEIGLTLFFSRLEGELPVITFQFQAVLYLQLPDSQTATL